MNLSTKLKIAAAVSLGLTTSAVAYAQSIKPEDAITARRAVMQVISLNFGPLGAMVKGDIPFDLETFRNNAERMAMVSKMPLKDFFVDWTDKDVGEVRTRALPEIWLDWENFEKKLEAMRTEVAKLAEISRGDDRDAMRNQVGEVGKNCKACHDSFRNS